MNNIEIDKSQVALRFAQAGQSYTVHAVIQKRIAEQLFVLIQQYCPLKLENVLEIGCGSGNLSHLMIENFKIKTLLLNDLYPEIRQHFQQYSQQYLQQIANIEYLIGDIEQIEFPNYLDLVASSSALQWIHDLDGVLQKIYYSLNSQSFLCFSTFGEQNLKEIKALTGQGLDYLSIDSLRNKLSQNGFEILHISEHVTHLTFEHPKQVLQHLKATGVTATASNFRWTKQSLVDFFQAYQQFCHEPNLEHIQPDSRQYPLTYHPIYCIARKIA